MARSLDSARTRAEDRVQRFLDAALELMESGDGKEFTVQEVVDRSGQSLRSFYQYFGGKHELLLALFEESIRTTADHLREWSPRKTTPLERVHRFVIEYYRLCRPAPKGKAAKKRPRPSPVLVEFAQQLLTDHPAEAAAGVRAARRAVRGAPRRGRCGRRHPCRAHRSHVAGVVLEAIMFNAFSATIAGVSVRANAADAAEELWDLVFHGLAAAAAD